MPSEIERYAKASNRRRKKGSSWIDNTRAGQAAIQKRKAQIVQFAEQDVDLNERLGESMNAEIARTVSHDDDADTLAKKVGSVMERAASERLGLIIGPAEAEVQQLHLQQDNELARLEQITPKTAETLGRKNTFSRYMRLPAALAARLALAVSALGVSGLELVLLHRPLASQVFARFAGSLANPPWSIVATAITVIIINGLTWFTARLAIDRAEKLRLARQTKTEPPPTWSLLIIQIGALAVLVLQALLVFIRFAGDNTGHRSPVVSTLSIIAILGVAVVGIVEASLAGSPAMWNEKILDTYRELHGKAFNELPRAIYLHTQDLRETKVGFFRTIANVIAPEWSSAAHSYIAAIVAPEPHAYEFSWPKSIPPPTFEHVIEPRKARTRWLFGRVRPEQAR